jgi:hypothetical protein
VKAAALTYGPFVAIMLLLIAIDKRGHLSFLAPSAAPTAAP